MRNLGHNADATLIGYTFLQEKRGEDTMRWGQAILGIVMVLAGGVWFLQGIRVIPGSMMTGSRFWMIVGAVVAIVGIVLLARGAGAGSRNR